MIKKGQEEGTLAPDGGILKLCNLVVNMEVLNQFGAAICTAFISLEKKS